MYRHASNAQLAIHSSNVAEATRLANCSHSVAVAGTFTARELHWRDVWC